MIITDVRYAVQPGQLIHGKLEVELILDKGDQVDRTKAISSGKRARGGIERDLCALGRECLGQLDKKFFLLHFFLHDQAI
jgi:hypothetical protein